MPTDPTVCPDCGASPHECDWDCAAQDLDEGDFDLDNI